MDTTVHKYQDLNAIEMEFISGGGWLSYLFGICAKASQYNIESGADYYATCLGH